MKTTFLQRLLSLVVINLLLISQTWATCGGGGGGGMGGMSPGAGMGGGEQVYYVPWKLIKPEDTIKEGLIVYWFPSSTEEFQRSSLRVSRSLTTYSSQCVTMGVADAGTSLGQKFASGDKLPVAILTAADGTVLGKAENNNGRLKVEQVEKLVESEIKKREESIKERMEDAKGKAKSGDNAAAIEEYRAVLGQKCLFPKRAKDAAKELKKLGVTDVAEVPDSPNMDAALTAKIERTMAAGLKAENAARYIEAERLYDAAHRIDPADPVPLRYLGELYRHHIGDWQKARATFDAILTMQADPLSRAVALHGLGKMTIHEGEFKKGLGLMERSIAVYPLALAYRNLAVYWNSEGDTAKADRYTQEALKLDPKDPYNLVFAAVFMSNHEEALKIARANEALLPASYNLAAIYAQAGEKEKALALLKRHFFEYERYQSVRSKEMMEARVDAVFALLMSDPQFMSLTSGADGRLPMRMSPAGAGQQ